MGSAVFDTDKDLEDSIKKATHYLTVVGSVFGACLLCCIPFLVGMCCGLGMCVSDDSYY